jgi:hypothetical protein
MMRDCKDCEREIRTIKDHAPDCTRAAKAMELARHFLNDASMFRNLAERKKEEEHG